MSYEIIAVFDQISIFQQMMPVLNAAGRLPARGLPRELRTARRVRADLAGASLPPTADLPAAFRRTAELCLEARSLRLEVAPCARDLHGVFAQSPLLLRKSFQAMTNIGTGSLVTRERSAALERWRRRLHELVCAHGSGKRSAGKRAPFGSDALSQELDPGALCRARSVLLAGRDAGSAPDRSHRAHGDAMRGARAKDARRAARCAPRRAPRRPSRARTARDRDRAGIGQP